MFTFLYSLFKSTWKLWTFLFQCSLVFELIITVHFWILIWPQLNDDECSEQKFDLKCLSMCINHSLPIFCLSLDYLYNAQPFVRRHYSLICFLSCIYLSINFAVVRYTGIPIYDFLNWQSYEGFLWAFAVLLLSFLIFLMLEKLNVIKLKAMGYHQILLICQNKKFRY